MKKLIFSLLLLLTVCGFSLADKAIILTPGWNVISTPKVLSWISFSNSWVGVSFYKLAWSTWQSVIPNVENINPLEWFVVNNSNTWNVVMNLIYKINVSPMEVLFQKTLNLGWNLVWISTISNPFASIWSNAVISVDFTKNYYSNLLNKVNTSFTVNNGWYSIASPEYWEAYGLFSLASWVLYGWSQDTNSDSSRNVTLYNDSSLGWSKNIYAWSTWNVLFSWSISVDDPIILENLNLHCTLNSSSAIISKMTLKINDSSVDYTPTDIWSFTWVFPGSRTINPSSKISVLVAIQGYANTWDFVCDNLDINSFWTKYYASNNQNITSASGSLTGQSFIIKKWDVTLTRDITLPSTSTVSPGTNNVVVLKWTIDVDQPVTFEDLVITGTFSSAVSKVTLKIGNTTSTYTPTNSTWPQTIYLDGTFTVNSSSVVQILADVKATATNWTISFEPISVNKFSLAQYVSNWFTVNSWIGNISSSIITVQWTTLNVTRNDGLWNNSIAAWSNGLLIYGLNLASSEWNWVTLSNINLSVSGYNNGFLNNVFLTLYIDWVAIQSKTVSSSTVTFDGFSKSILSNSSINVQVKADMAEAFNTWTIQLILNSLNAYDTLTSNAINSYSKPIGAIFTVATPIGTLASSNNNPLSKLLLSPSTAQQIAAFKLSATNDNIKLYNISITWTNLDMLSNFKLLDLSGTLIANATTTTSTTVTFISISGAPTIAKDTSASYYILADVNSNTNGWPVSLTIITSWTNFRSSNGTTYAVGWSNVLSNSHAISENTLVLAMSSNPSKSLTTSALRFTATAAGKNSVIITWLNFNNMLAGYTGSMTLMIYKDSIAAGNIAGTGAYAWGIIALNANNVIDAGTTTNYIVVINGALVDAGSYTTDWYISLTNVYFGGLAGATYSNVGSFPFTSVK